MMNTKGLISLAVLLTLTRFAVAAENDRGFVPLFDGKTLTGWKVVDGNGRFAVEDGAIVGTAVSGTTSTFLCTEKRYRDFILEVEFSVDDGMNSGVQIRSNRTPSYQHGQVHGYQVEIDPSRRAWSGGVFDQDRRGWLNDLKNNEPARKAFRHNQWNKFRIECRGDSIKTWINGVPAADLRDSMTPEGFIALQIHGVGDLAKPLHVRFRNIRLKELGKGTARQDAKVGVRGVVSRSGNRVEKVAFQHS